jgi:hypothetical protein
LKLVDDVGAAGYRELYLEPLGREMNVFDAKRVALAEVVRPLAAWRQVRAATNNFSELTNFIWNVANLIRDSFKRRKYRDVSLPVTVPRRVNAVVVLRTSS